MRNSIQPGNVLELTAPGTLSSGDPTMIGDLFCVAITDVASGARGSFAVAGVANLTKDGSAISEGDKLYFDGDDVTTDSDTGSNPQIGNATEDAASEADTVNVRIQN